MSDIADTRTVEPLNIGRALFLKVRCAYLRAMLARGETYAVAMNAINIHDHMQAQLIGMTEPGFGDGTVTPDLCAIVAALPDEQLIDVAKAAGFFESGRRVADFGFAQMRAKQDAMKERDAALAENARLREALAEEQKLTAVTAEWHMREKALADSLREELAHAREAERERCAAVVNAIDSPPTSTDENIGISKGLALAEKAIRELKDEPCPNR